MSMDEKDFGKLIASFLRGESPPLSEEEVESGEGERSEKPRKAGKSLLESLMEGTDASRVESEAPDAGSEAEGIAARKGEAEIAEERADSLCPGVVEGEIHIFEPERPNGGAGEPSVRLKEVTASEVIAETIAKEERGSAVAAEGASFEEKEMPIRGEISGDLDADLAGEGEVRAAKVGIGEIPEVDGSPAEAAPPGSFEELAETISADLGFADVALSTADGLSIALAGVGGAEALATCVPDILRALEETGERVPLGSLGFALIQSSEGGVALAPVGDDLFLIVRAGKDVSPGLLIWTLKRHVKFLGSGD